MAPDHDNVVRLSFLTKIIGGSVGLIVIIMIAAIGGTISAESKQNEKIRLRDSNRNGIKGWWPNFSLAGLSGWNSEYST